MEGLSLVLAVGLRPGEPGEDPGLLGQIVSDPLVTLLRPAALTTGAVARLVRETLSPDADDAFCLRVTRRRVGTLSFCEFLHQIASKPDPDRSERAPPA